jgi:hypothetical protein
MADVDRALGMLKQAYERIESIPLEYYCEELKQRRKKERDKRKWQKRLRDREQQ